MAQNKDSKILSGMTLGLSISESPEIESLGFSKTHFEDLFIEFARYMMASGVTLAYGGDFRAGGFTEILFGIHATYRGEKIESYLGWPLFLGVQALFNKRDKGEKLTESEIDMLENLSNAAVFHYSPLPEEYKDKHDPNKFLPPIKPNPEIMMVWARSMSLMRRNFLAKNNDAQILLGGRLEGYSSKYPGVVEEAYEVMKAGKPIFLIGAFGGSTGAVINAITGKKPESLTLEGQYKLWETWGETAQKAASTKQKRNLRNAPALIKTAEEALAKAKSQLANANEALNKLGAAEDDVLEEAEEKVEDFKKMVASAEAALKKEKGLLVTAEKFDHDNPPPTQNYKGLVEHYNANVPADDEPIDYENLIKFFEEKGIAGLNNKLTEEENLRLFTTPHVSEMIALVLKGLVRIKNV